MNKDGYIQKYSVNASDVKYRLTDKSPKVVIKRKVKVYEHTLANFIDGKKYEIDSGGTNYVFYVPRNEVK